MLRISIPDMRRIAVQLEREARIKRMIAQVEGMMARHPRGWPECRNRSAEAPKSKKHTTIPGITRIFHEIRVSRTMISVLL